MRGLVEKIARLGEWIIGSVHTVGELGLLTLQTALWTVKGRHDRKILSAQLNEIGVNSLPMITVTALFTGLVLVVQVGRIFADLSAETFIGGTVGLSMARELAPVVTAVVVAGRIGSAMAAELGTMKVTEQIDALICLSTNPVSYLVVPRVLACTIMVPVLTIYANVIGLVGGAVAAVAQVGITLPLFTNSVVEYVAAEDFVSGVFKAMAFGVIVGVVGCYKGLTCGRGAEGVGRATTGAVVWIVTMVLVTNYFLSLLFFSYRSVMGG